MKPTPDEEADQRARNFIIFKAPLTDEEMRRAFPTPWWILAVVIICILAGLAIPFFFLR